MLSFLKRNRSLLLVSLLLAYPGATFLATRGQGRELNVVDRFVLNLSAWVQGLFVVSIDGTVGVARNYVALRGVQTENAQLREQLEALRSEAQAAAELRSENDRLKKLVGYAVAQPGVKVVARVVGVNPVPTLLSLRIDRGQADGIQAGLPVVTPDGILGQVLRSTRSTADVLIIDDPNSRVGGRLQKSRARVTVAGSGDRRALRLENLLRTDPVEDGELVVTSGADGVFPGGLPVGKVVSVDRKTIGMFQPAQLTPAVDPTRVEEVFVLITPDAWTAEHTR